MWYIICNCDSCDYSVTDVMSPLHMISHHILLLKSKINKIKIKENRKIKVKEKENKMNPGPTFTTLKTCQSLNSTSRWSMKYTKNSLYYITVKSNIYTLVEALVKNQS